MNLDIRSALTRVKLDFFIEQAFRTVSPGDVYHRNWHIDAIIHQLLRVEAGQTRRLLINQPPRSLKSICISVAYVAWLIGRDPRKRIIVASYSADLAAALHLQFRMVVESDWYRSAFPNVRWMRNTAQEWVTAQGGGRNATSVGGTLTGRGADLIIIDDPLNANEAESELARRRVAEWYSASLVTRLNDQRRGTIIAVMQRLHEDDLAGVLLRQGTWDTLILSAIATQLEHVDLGNGRQKIRRPGGLLHPAREDRAALERMRVEIGSLRFSAQYQQQPVPPEGNLIRREWFVAYERAPASGRIVQSWDIASGVAQSNDYSVCTTWMIKNQDWYLIEVWRGRLAYPDLRRKLVQLAGQHKPDTILIENAGAGIPLLQDLRVDDRLAIVRPIGIRPDGAKEDRVSSASARIEAGHVHIPKDAPWLSDFLHEVLAFPNGRHDDQVDSMSQFLIWARRDAYQADDSIGMPIQVY